MFPTPPSGLNAPVDVSPVTKPDPELLSLSVAPGTGADGAGREDAEPSMMIALIRASEPSISP